MKRNYRRDLIDRQDRWVRNATGLMIETIYRLENPSMQNLSTVIAKGYGVTVADIQSMSRWWLDSAARQLLWALACRFTKFPRAEIAAFTNRKCHTNVVRSCKRYDDLIDELLLEAGLEIPRRRTYGREVIIGEKKRIVRPSDSTREMLTLAALEEWSIDDAFTHPEDLMPHVDSSARCKRLSDLKRKGFAESERDEQANYWRITDAGRAALKELRVGGMAVRTDTTMGEPGRFGGNEAARSSLEEAAA